MLISQLLINLGLYGGIPLLILISAYFFGHSAAARQAALNELESKIEQDKRINKAEQTNADLEGVKNEKLKNIDQTIDPDKLISLFKSLFSKN